KPDGALSFILRARPRPGRPLTLVTLGRLWGVSESALVFARHENDAVDALAEHAVGAAIKLHLGQRKIGVVEVLPVKCFCVAVITGDCALVIVMHFERPDLKWLGFDCLVMLLGYGDDVEQPVGAAVFGNVLGSIRVGDIADERVAVPVFAAGELIEVVVAEGMLSHIP